MTTKNVAPNPSFIAASLVDAIKRRANFSSNFVSSSQFEIVDSVDGRAWSEEQADALTTAHVRELRREEKRQGRFWFGPAAVACAITHRDRLQSRAEQSDAVLCEDDVDIARDFVELWQQSYVRENFRRCDGVVLIYYFSRHPIRAERQEVARFGRYSIHKLHRSGVRSSACYYVNPEVAASIRDNQTPVSYPADHWEEMQADGVFNHIYAVHPSPCRLGGFASNIGYSNSAPMKHRELGLFRVLRKLRRFLQLRRKSVYENIELDATINAPSD